MSDQNLEPAAEDLLKAGKKICDKMSDTPALYSIAVSLKRIADCMTYVPKMPELTPEQYEELKKHQKYYNNNLMEIQK